MWWRSNSRWSTRPRHSSRSPAGTGVAASSRGPLAQGTSPTALAYLGLVLATVDTNWTTPSENQDGCRGKTNLER